MKTTFEFFEIRSTDDNYGLCGTFESEEKALEEINRSYEEAKTRGYDNKYNKWIIVCNQIVKETNKNGEFAKETTVRFAIASVEYSSYENAFVFVY